MLSSQPSAHRRSTRQSASLCVKEPPLTQSCDVRPCDGVWQHSRHIVVSDNQLFLTTLSHGQGEGLHNDVCESRRHDVRLQVQFVEENLAVAELVQRRVWNRSTYRGDEAHVPRSMCRLSDGVQLVLSPR